MPKSFVTEYFQIFIVDEVKNFAINNIYSSCQSQSHTQDPCKRLVTIWRFVHQGKKGYYKIKSNWILKQRFNCSLLFRDRPRVVIKIPYTCNCLIMVQWILESGGLKIIQLGFFLFVNKSPCQIYFTLHLVFLVIFLCFHDLHAIELN